MVRTNSEITKLSGLEKIWPQEMAAISVEIMGTSCKIYEFVENSYEFLDNINTTYLVGGLEHFLFFHILGIIAHNTPN